MDSLFGQFLHDVFGSFDMAVFSGFGAIQNPVLNEVAAFISAFGSEKFCILLGALALILCFVRPYRK